MCDTYNGQDIDIEELDRKGFEMMNREFVKPTKDDVEKYRLLIEAIAIFDNALDEKQLTILKRKYKFSGKNSFLFQVYLELIKNNKISNDNEEKIRKSLQIKSVKSHSGITNITVFTSPYPSYTNDEGYVVTQSFSCTSNCSYCPNAPGYPRSYLLNEPAVLRAVKHKFDCLEQIHSRMNTLYLIGNDVFKLEVNVLGGTFTSYPNKYREEFVRDIYYAANIFWDKNKRDKLSLSDEKQINETAKSRIVLIAVEIRPDSVTIDEIKFLRYLSITRIQMGIQHTDDEILKKINRKCTTARTIQAIEMLRRHGFKIDAHFMTNLPFSNPEKDRKMLIDELCGLKSSIKREIKNTPTLYQKIMGIKTELEYWEYYNLSHPEIICDQYKIYPCAVLIYTEIEKWFKEGSYIPYDEKYLVDILLDFKTLIFPWIRINRIMRDFYETNIFSKSGKNLSMRDQLHSILKKEGKQCNCIRCREVKSKTWDGTYILVIRKHFAGNGDEYFISAESKDYNTLYGFVRLRLDDATNKIFPELNGCALIREIHVYSTVTNFHKEGNVQHKGLGSKLMKKAEEIARDNARDNTRDNTRDNKYSKIAVIAAVGSRGFYEKIGYTLDPGEGEYMIKKL